MNDFHLRCERRTFVGVSHCVLSLCVPDEVKARLDRLSASTKRPADAYVREALNAYLDDLEDYYEAAEVSRRIREGTEETLSLEAARRELLA